jgi:DNA-binding GntR family transcriptional regulator
MALGRATEELDTSEAAPEVAEHIGIEPDEVVLKLDRLVRSVDGVPVEWRVVYLRMDSNDLEG